TAILLEARVALLARTLLWAVGVEAADRCPGAGGSRLTRLGVEGCDEGDRVGQAAAGQLQVVLADPAPVQPHPQAGGAEELGDADSLVNGRLLGGAHPELVLVDQQLACRLRVALRPHPGTTPDLLRRSPGARVGQAQGPFIPRLKPGAFWPYSVIARELVRRRGLGWTSLLLL